MNLIRSMMLKILVFSLTLVFVPFAVFVVLLFSPILLFRWIVSNLSKHLNPSLGKMLTARSLVFAISNPYVKPKSNCVGTLIVEGRPNIEILRNEITEKIINIKLKTGEPRFPELKQYVTSWMGFFHWKWDSNFDIKNHVIDCDPENNTEYEYIDDAKLTEIVAEFIQSPYPKDTSPWSITIIPNYHPKIEKAGVVYSIVILKWHHALSDYLSILEGFLYTLDGRAQKGTIKQPNFRKKSFFKRILRMMTFIIQAPYEFVHQQVTLKDNYEWMLPSHKLKREWSGAFTERIPLEYFKKIRDIYKSTVTTIIFAGIAGGIRNYMLKNDVKVPKAVHLMVPIPAPNHPDKLRNHLSLGILRLPVGTRDPEERIKKIHRSFEDLRKSTMPVTAFYLLKFVGSLFPFMVRIATKLNLRVTGVMTNLPGPHDIIFCGHPITEIYCASGLGDGDMICGISAFSYLQGIQLSIGMDKSIIPTNDGAAELLNCIYQEYDNLMKNDV